MGSQKAIVKVKKPTSKKNSNKVRIDAMYNNLQEAGSINRQINI